MNDRIAKILQVLAEHPEGLSTPQIAELAGDDMRHRQRALSHCGTALRKLEGRGNVERCGIIPAAYKSVPTQVWRIKDASHEVESKHGSPLAPAVPRPLPTAVPAIWQMVALLPPEGSEFPAWRRRLWLIAVAAILDFVYAENAEDGVLIHAIETA